MNSDRRTDFKKKIKRATIIVASLIIVSIALALGIDYSLRSDLERAKIQARAAGFTFTPEDIIAIVPHVTKEENSGRDILELIGWETKNDYPPNLKYRLPQNITSENWKAYEKNLPKLNLAQADLDKVIRGKAPYYNTPWKEGFSIPTRLELYTKRAISLVAMKAALLAHQDRRLESLKLIALILAASNHVGTQPYVDSMVARIMYFNMVASLLSRLDWNKPLSIEELNLMTKIQDTCAMPPTFDYYLKFELARTHIEFENNTIAETTVRILKDKGLRAFVTERLLKSQYGLHIHARHLTLSAFILNKSRTANTDSIQFLKAMRAFSTYTMDSPYNTDSWIKLCYFPEMDYAAITYLKLLAIRRILSNGRNKSGAIDPFTEKPFKSQTTGNTTTFYSFGADGIDNNRDPKSDDFSISLPSQAYGKS